MRSHPLVFNESFLSHAHCIVQTGLALRIYASDHGGHFPTDTNGYGNALLCVSNEVSGFWGCLTGPGYDGSAFAEAAQTGRPIPESKCGRVYVQGLKESDDATIAMLFDKLPTPGGDHTHGLSRLSAPLGREVSFIDGSHRFIPETAWPQFCREQIEKLITTGMAKEKAERIYGSREVR